MMDATLQAMLPYLEQIRQQVTKEFSKTAMDEPYDSLLRKLGSVLAGNTTCKTVKQLHKLCNAVVPPLGAIQHCMFQELWGIGRIPGYLQLFLDLNIPANLVSFMALTLRAGYSLVPLPESAKATSDIAAHGWSLAADFYNNLVSVCHHNRISPYSCHNSALFEQLATGSEGQEPGKARLDACLYTEHMSARKQQQLLWGCNYSSPTGTARS
jgi:hypothetical protein